VGAQGQGQAELIAVEGAVWLVDDDRGEATTRVAQRGEQSAGLVDSLISFRTGW
jgi:hypothetical protein